MAVFNTESVSFKMNNCFIVKVSKTFVKNVLKREILTIKECKYFQVFYIVLIL